jgi:uncharacterized protein
MPLLEKITQLLQQEKKRLKEIYHVERIGIFGSVARGEATETSDVDILVEFSEPIGLDFVTMADELELLLGCPVDVLPRDAIRTRLWPFIEKDLRYV